MRMVHYYLCLALVLAPALLATLATGIWHDGSQRHLVLGLFTGILCVATNTLLILFMIVTGRVLKAAMAARSLAPAFLAELNEFFARKRAYPAALIAASLAAATAVLGYGAFIGVPTTVHLLLGLATVVVNLATLQLGVRTLRENQALLDRVTRELDRLDREGAPVHGPDGPEWAFGRASRWLIFAGSAWLPYLYWALIVWRGDFGGVPAPFLVGTALVSILGVVLAWRSRSAERAATD